MSLYGTECKFLYSLFSIGRIHHLCLCDVNALITFLPQMATKSAFPVGKTENTQMRHKMKSNLYIEASLVRFTSKT